MSYTFEADYLDLLYHLIDRGEERADRTGTGTFSSFGHSMNIDLTQGFPLVTTKKMAFKSILSELLWFIEGSGDERRLAEILHGTRDENKKTIWSPNAEGTSGSLYKPKFPGDLGRIYGVQWRKWKKHTVDGYNDFLHFPEGGTAYYGAKVIEEEVDQLSIVVNKLKNNPTDRRIILSALNVGELDQMALPPCHMFAQFYVSKGKMLSCMMTQRSVDAALGLPFNIASYALLTHMLARVCGYTPAELIINMGDVHIYKDHINGVEEQLERNPRALPNLVINNSSGDIDSFKMADFVLEGYDPHPAISFKMSA